MEKQPLHGSPGMFSVGIEATVNLGNYENRRVGLVMSFSAEQTKPEDAYTQVRAIVDGWAADIRFQKGNVDKMVSDALPAPTGKLAQVMDALAPHTHRLLITNAPSVILVKTRGRLDRNTWGEIDTLVRGQGGAWKGTRDGLEGKDVHWEIPK